VIVKGPTIGSTEIIVMNEILRAKKLTEEILARAAAIQSHMADCNARMANMERIEQEAKSRLSGEAAEPVVSQSMQLLDLSDDVLGAVVKALKSYDGLVAFSQASRTRQCIIAGAGPIIP